MNLLTEGPHNTLLFPPLPLASKRTHRGLVTTAQPPSTPPHQMPRRQRALARLRTRVSASSFSVPTLSGYLLPMLRHLVLREAAKEADVAEEAVATLRALAAQLPWRPYLLTLQAFARLLKKAPQLEKRLVRLDDG